MEAKRISLFRANIRILSGHLGHIAPYEHGRVKESMLPLPVNIIDAETGEEFECQLITLVPLQNQIPEVFQLFSEGRLVEPDEILRKYKKENFNQLAFYVYERRNHPTAHSSVP